MTRPVVVIDTGPLVALLNSSERSHQVVKKAVDSLPGPFLTVEPVLTESCFLLRRVTGGPAAVMGLARDGVLQVKCSLEREAEAIERLLKKYNDVPMSLADACLVRLVELTQPARLLTFDGDFRIYRHHRNKRVEVIDLGPELR